MNGTTLRDESLSMERSSGGLLLLLDKIVFNGITDSLGTNSGDELIDEINRIRIGYEIKNLHSVLSSIENDIVRSRKQNSNVSRFIPIPQQIRESIKQILIQIYDNGINLSRFRNGIEMERYTIRTLKNHLFFSNIVSTMKQSSEASFPIVSKESKGIDSADSKESKGIDSKMNDYLCIMQKSRQLIEIYSQKYDSVSFNIDTLRTKLNLFLFEQFRNVSEDKKRFIYESIYNDFLSIFFVSILNELTNKRIEYERRNDERNKISKANEIDILIDKLLNPISKQFNIGNYFKNTIRESDYEQLVRQWYEIKIRTN